jgi:hypothetical protein
MDIFKERENQVVSKLLFIQGGQASFRRTPICFSSEKHFKYILKIYRFFIPPDNINRYISSIKRRIEYCQIWAENWTQINVFNKEEKVLQEILRYILERMMSCLDIENKVERMKMTYCLKIETFLKIHQTRKQSIENNFILEVTE